MQTDTATTKQPLNLDAMLQSVDSEVKENLPAVATNEMEPQIDNLVKSLVGISDPSQQQALDFSEQVKAFGISAQKDSGKRSQMLKQTISKLDPTNDGGEDSIGNQLLNLNAQCEALDISGVSFDDVWWSNLTKVLPFLKTPIQRYFLRYQSADAVIDNIRTKLVKGQNMLKNDNQILLTDQRKMRETLIKLREAIAAGLYFKQQLDYAVENEITDSDMKEFVQDQVLYPLNQRITDLQQQAAVNQQGIMSAALIIRTNEDLITGVDRAITVTMTAMEIAVSLSLALANQRMVLKTLKAVNETTSNMIANTGKLLKQNSEEIAQQSADATLDVEKLVTALADTRQAIENVRTFRIGALDHMSANIETLNESLTQNSKTIDQMDQGQQVRDAFDIISA